jgi:hypothetical protein
MFLEVLVARNVVTVLPLPAAHVVMAAGKLTVGVAISVLRDGV